MTLLTTSPLPSLPLWEAQGETVLGASQWDKPLGLSALVARQRHDGSSDGRVMRSPARGEAGGFGGFEKNVSGECVGGCRCGGG